ncbi:MAG: hypothetical protein AAFV62_00940, partial [Pseudomonadota bacterium]
NGTLPGGCSAPPHRLPLEGSAWLLALMCTVLLLAPVPGIAEDASTAPSIPPSLPTAGDAEVPSIPLAEFRSLVSGKTLHFILPDGSPWGREWYQPGTQRSVFVFRDGTCFDGQWERKGNRYCYYYRDEPSCWLTHYEGDRIKVISRTQMVQYVARITSNEPLSCDPELLSRAEPTVQPTAPHGEAG